MDSGDGMRPEERGLVDKRGGSNRGGAAPMEMQKQLGLSRWMGSGKGPTELDEEGGRKRDLRGEGGARGRTRERVELVGRKTLEPGEMARHLRGMWARL